MLLSIFIMRFERQDAKNGQFEILRQRFETGVMPEMRPYPNWVVWKLQYLPDEDRFGKIPFSPQTGKPADMNDPSTWGKLDEALDTLREGSHSGVGFVFSENDPFTGNDFDYCIDDTGRIAPWAMSAIMSLNSYTEITGSGRGLHILTQAKLSGENLEVKVPGLTHRHNIEMHGSGRFYTVSARPLPGLPFSVEPRQQEQEAWYQKAVALK